MNFLDKRKESNQDLNLISMSIYNIKLFGKMKNKIRTYEQYESHIDK